MADYRDKIRRYRMRYVYRVLLVIICLGILLTIIYVQYKNHIYTDYDVISTIEKKSVIGTTNEVLGSNILTYSHDGAQCTDSSGQALWNQTYEMQNILVEISGDVVAIGDYNGHEVYVLNSEKKMYEIDTTMPIRSIAVSSTGRTAVAVADTKTTWVYIYESDGTQKYEIKTTMEKSGYPVAFGFSPNGELLGLSCVYVDSGIVKSQVAFYNFGAVGENKSDYLVNGYTYHDSIIPYITFLQDGSAVAVGDDRVVFYCGEQIPTSCAEYLQEDEIQGVYSGNGYLGVLLRSDQMESVHKMIIYSKDSTNLGSYYFNTDFHDIFFTQNYFVAYGDTECLISTYDNIEKYNGPFNKTVELMIPVGNPGSYKFTLVSSNSIDVVQFK
ncbi:MAG: hypothetical protein IJ324_12135 [Lachnospiraceae bacterium]|nr:hypothetical protein [Lachnospiraceae bacterium]